MCPSPASDSAALARMVDERVEQRMRELLREGVLRTDVAPRSLPLGKLAQEGASSGMAPVWDGTRYVPADVATQVELDALDSDLTAHVADTDAAHAGTAISVTETGIIIPSSTNVQRAMSQVEAYVQNLEERFEQHHHDERYMPRVGQWYRSSAQTIANATPTKITGWTENYAPGSYATFDGSNHRIVINESGTYVVKTNMIFTSAALGGIRTMEIYRNGASYKYGLIPNDPTGLTSTASELSATVTCRPGDYYELWVYQSSGGNLNTGSGSYLTMDIEKLY